MALSHTILMLISECPRSGYDIGKEFDECVGHYWQATSQQIYRELSKMEKLEWVEAEAIAQEGRPNKKVFSITAAGTEELLDWMGQPSEPMCVREDLLVKVRAGHLVEPQVLIEELTRRQEIHAGKLAQLLEMEREHFSEPDELEGESLMIYLTLRCGLRYESMWVEWSKEAIARMKLVAEKAKGGETVAMAGG
ncbi:MAG: PadR family transcriptional regulator [Cyanobacteria bacterium P01_E01_bin.48]